MSIAVCSGPNTPVAYIFLKIAEFGDIMHALTVTRLANRMITGGFNPVRNRSLWIIMDANYHDIELAGVKRSLPLFEVAPGIAYRGIKTHWEILNLLKPVPKRLPKN